MPISFRSILARAGLRSIVFTLERTVRFAVNPAGDSLAGLDPSDRDPNGYAGVPAMRGLGAHYELDIACRGEPDAVTGYLISITDIDKAARARAIPLIAEAARERPATDPGDLLPSLFAALSEPLAEHGASLSRLRWRLSPFYNVEMTSANQTDVTIRQRFEFAAAHRLHSPEMTDEENQRVYGKCNNPSGHGHNYVLEPAVRVPLEGADRLDLPTLERLVETHVLNRFDHKHLNRDLPDFSGEVPSVERIAKRCYELLAPPVESAGGTLDSLTVWETEKTSCTYAPAPRAETAAI